MGDLEIHSEALITKTKAIKDGHEYVLWDIDKMVVEFPSIQYKGIKPHKVSNVLRTLVLQKYGGLYIDADTKLIDYPENLSKFTIGLALERRPSDHHLVKYYSDYIYAPQGLIDFDYYLQHYTYDLEPKLHMQLWTRFIDSLPHENIKIYDKSVLSEHLMLQSWKNEYTL